MTTDASTSPAADGVAAKAPFLHKVIKAGQLRYWIIASWALALTATVPWRLAVMWFAGTTAIGLVRTIVESRPTTGAAGQARMKLAVATISCIAWACAPLIAYFAGDAHGFAIAIALLMAGYTLVFTQMRAAPREALIVSAPYTVVVLILAFALPGLQGTWTILSMMPVLGLSLLIKVVITEIKDADLEAVNHRQATLIDDLAAARDRAHAANDAKSSFLAVISHELRTPMNGVLGAAQLLETTGLGETQQTYVSIIRQSGESLLVQLNDILDLTKIETGHMELDLTETATAEMAERMIGPFRAQAEAKGLDFRLVTTGPAPASVRIDALRIAQITHNLLGNAVKFTDAGEVSLTIAREKLSETRAGYRITVADTGAGIAEADLGQLFQPFTQVDASSTRRFGGTGLGLSICRQLAALMGGDVTVTSVLGEGSAFTFALEVEVVAWPEAAPVAEQGVAAAVETPSLRILVVEDHPVNRMILHAWLGGLGHGCVMAENGQLGLDCAGVEAFDLIIMDVNMPVMDGLTATRELRARAGPNQETPIAVLSASARSEDHSLGHAAGADVYVNKPVDFGALAVVLDAAASGRNAVRSLQPEAAAA